MDISVYVIAAGAFAYAVKIYVIDQVKIEQKKRSRIFTGRERGKGLGNLKVYF